MSSSLWLTRAIFYFCLILMITRALYYYLIMSTRLIWVITKAIFITLSSQNELFFVIDWSNILLLSILLLLKDYSWFVLCHCSNICKIYEGCCVIVTLKSTWDSLQMQHSSIITCSLWLNQLVDSTALPTCVHVRAKDPVCVFVQRTPTH